MKPNTKVNKPVVFIPELLRLLHEKDKSTYSRMLTDMKLPSVAFEKYATWSDNCYTRNCIEENEAFELILICWEGEQSTAIHDHGGEECWVYFVDGEFSEEVYNLNDVGKLQVVKTTDSSPGDVSYMIDFMGYHRLKNKSVNRAMSLHLYAKPIKSCKVYDTAKNDFIPKELRYDNYKENSQAIILK